MSDSSAAYDSKNDSACTLFQCIQYSSKCFCFRGKHTLGMLQAVCKFMRNVRRSQISASPPRHCDLCIVTGKFLLQFVVVVSYQHRIDRYSVLVTGICPEYCCTTVPLYYSTRNSRRDLPAECRRLNTNGKYQDVGCYAEDTKIFGVSMKNRARLTAVPNLLRGSLII